MRLVEVLCDAGGYCRGGRRSGERREIAIIGVEGVECKSKGLALPLPYRSQASF